MKTIEYKDLIEKALRGVVIFDGMTARELLKAQIEANTTREVLKAHRSKHFDALIEVLEKIADPNAPVPNDGQIGRASCRERV